MDLTVQIAHVADSYRLGESGEAHEALAQLIDGLAAALARPPLAARATPIMTALEEVLQAQLRADTLGIADLLQYRLAPLVTR